MRVTIVGVGLIGRAWAISFARAGHEVTLWSRKPEAAKAALAYIADLLPVLEDNDLLSGRDPQDILAALRIQPDLADALSMTDYVQESTAEDPETKRAVFSMLDELAPRQAVLASSTSAILPSLFSEGLAGRARCLVVHPINPPYLVPAVEVVPAPWTCAKVVDEVCALLTSAGQSPIVMTREIDGFVMNRLQGALLDEAFRLVSEGYASTEDVDIGLRDGLGLRWSFMGPFETIDLNSPGGVREYVVRYQSLYANLFAQRQRPVDWTGRVLEEIEGHRRSLLPLGRLGERQSWRDRRLAALIAHKREAMRQTDGEAQTARAVTVRK